MDDATGAATFVLTAGTPPCILFACANYVRMQHDTVCCLYILVCCKSNFGLPQCVPRIMHIEYSPISN